MLVQLTHARIHEHTNTNARAHAQACGMSRCDKVVVPLVEALSCDASAVVRRAMAMAMTGLIDQIGAEKSIERLRSSLLRFAHDTDDAVRSGACTHSRTKAGLRRSVDTQCSVLINILHTQMRLIACHSCTLP